MGMSVYMLPTEVDAKHWETIMEDKENLRAEIRQLNARATKLKMDLHDLAEELPLGWEKIPGLAQQAFTAYEDLMVAKARLASLPGG